MLVIGLSLALLASLYYNFKLNRRLKSYEHTWEEIERVADRNQDGSFTIRVQHLEEHHPNDSFEVHEPVDGAPTIQIPNLLEALEHGGIPPRAA